MKRKKWSELEEQTLLSKYSDLLNSGTLPKLKTREKKFKPIAEHVNSVHHHQDPITFPFKWSWRDVSIKVQNMRHQYLGVKQKIRISSNDFNWADGEIHWENFLKYKQVFGDIELLSSSDHHGNTNTNSSAVKDCNSNGSNNHKNKFEEKGINDIFEEEIEDEVEEEEEEEEDGSDDDLGEGVKEGNQDLGFDEGKKLSKGFKGKRLRMVGARVLELRDVIVRREEKKREREWSREEKSIENETSRREREIRREKRLEEREDGVFGAEMELEEIQMMCVKRELEKRRRWEREFEEERRRRIKWEEKWEEEEMAWRERMVEMQMEHEKQMMQMHANACQNQLQIIGVVSRLVCQYFGSANDGLGGSLGTLPPQVLQNLQHTGGLGDSGKPDATSPSGFL